MTSPNSSSNSSTSLQSVFMDLSFNNATYAHYQSDRKQLIARSDYLGILKDEELREIVKQGAYNGGRFIFEEYNSDLSTSLIVNIVYPSIENDRDLSPALRNELWRIKIRFENNYWVGPLFRCFVRESSHYNLACEMNFCTSIHMFRHAECEIVDCNVPFRRMLGLCSTFRSSFDHGPENKLWSLKNLSAFVIRNYYHHQREVIAACNSLPPSLISWVFDRPIYEYYNYTTHQQRLEESRRLQASTSRDRVNAFFGMR